MKLDTIGRYLSEYIPGRGTKVGKISAQEAYARLGQPGFHMLDCNLEMVYHRGHVPGAVYVGYDGLAPELLPEDRDATLVFYCGSSI